MRDKIMSSSQYAYLVSLGSLGAGSHCALHIEAVEASLLSYDLLQLNHSLLVARRVCLVSSAVPLQEAVGVVWREIL